MDYPWILWWKVATSDKHASIVYCPLFIFPPPFVSPQNKENSRHIFPLNGCPDFELIWSERSLSGVQTDIQKFWHVLLIGSSRVLQHQAGWCIRQQDMNVVIKYNKSHSKSPFLWTCGSVPEHTIPRPWTRVFCSLSPSPMPFYFGRELVFCCVERSVEIWFLAEVKAWLTLPM